MLRWRDVILTKLIKMCYVIPIRWCFFMKILYLHFRVSFTIHFINFELYIILLDSTYLRSQHHILFRISHLHYIHQSLGLNITSYIFLTLCITYVKSITVWYSSWLLVCLLVKFTQIKRINIAITINLNILIFYWLCFYCFPIKNWLIMSQRLILW